MFSGGRVLEGPRFPQVPLFCRSWPFSSFFLPFAGSGGFLLRAVSGDRLRLKEFDIAEVLCLCFGVIVGSLPIRARFREPNKTHRPLNARPPNPRNAADRRSLGSDLAPESRQDPPYIAPRPWNPWLPNPVPG